MSRTLRHLLSIVAALIGLAAMGSGMPAGSPAGLDPVNPNQFDPENPPGPDPMNPCHNVTVYYNPSYVRSTEVHRFEEDKEAMLVADDYSNYKFVSWSRDGEVVSNDHTYTFVMPHEAFSITKNYRYDPDNVSGPGESHPARNTLIEGGYEEITGGELLYYRVRQKSDLSLLKLSFTITFDERLSIDYDMANGEGHGYIMTATPVSANKCSVEIYPVENGTLDNGAVYSFPVLSPNNLRPGEEMEVGVSDGVQVTEENETYTAKSANGTIKCRGNAISEEGVEIVGGDLSLRVGDSRVLTATVRPEGAEQVVVWSLPEDNGIVEIVQTTDLSATINALAIGTTLVRASTVDGNYHSDITVSVRSRADEIRIEGSDDVVQIGSTLQLRAVITPESASDLPVEWSSDKPSVATVDQTGLVTGTGPGEATITVRLMDGSDMSANYGIRTQAGMSEITLEPTHIVLKPGGTATINATVYPEEAEQRVAWSGSGEDFIEIVETSDLSASIVAVHPGREIITATSVDGTAYAEMDVVVTLADTIEITGGDRTVVVGSETQLTTLISPEEAKDYPVYWEVDNETVATIGPTGILTAVSPGQTWVRAYIDDYSGIHTSCSITVIEKSTMGDITWSYDGRDLIFGSENPLATLYYSLDNSSFRVADGPIRLNPDIFRVYAYTRSEDNDPSETVEIEIPCFYDGGTMYLHRPNSMSKALEWCGGEVVAPTLTVAGLMGDDDFGVLREQTGVIGVDLSAAEPVGTPSLRDMSWLKWASLPLISDGGGMFEGCRGLGALLWKWGARIPAPMLADINNPNLLVYVAEKEAAPEEMTNVVVGTEGAYRAERIVLTHEGIANPYYAPYGFTAEEISYTRRFAQETSYDLNTRGYEAIMLPFDVETFTHPFNGACAPFEADRPNGEKPFWLYRLGAEMEAAASLEAYTPYVISMPNNEFFYDDYILGGRITFSATEAVVEATPELAVGKHRGTMEPVAKGDGILALNVGEVVDGHAEGSAWINDYRDLRTFEAYIVMEGAPNSMPVFDTAGVEEGGVSGDFRAWGEDGRICMVAPADVECAVYDVAGTPVARISLTSGQIERTKPLGHGVYIVRVGRRSVKVVL